MRDDLLDAQSAIDWAVAQIPVLEERIKSFLGRRPYEIEMEPDPKIPGDMLMVWYSMGPPDAVINAETGVIINSLRSSLDLLFTSILARNGMKQNTNQYFPIHGRKSDFLDYAKSLKRKQWMSQAEIAAIKQVRPYRRGNKALFILKEFDNIRKHRRLIELRPTPGGISLPMLVPHSGVWRHKEGKSVLLRFPAGSPGTGFLPTKDNTNVSLQVMFHEPSLGIRHAPVVGVLRHFAEAVQSIVAMFGTPQTD